jgi:hypothetical protein
MVKVQLSTSGQHIVSIPLRWVKAVKIEKGYEANYRRGEADNELIISFEKLD